MEKVIMKKGDKILIAVIVMAALAVAVLFSFREAGHEVAVYRNGAEEWRAALGSDATILLKGHEGQENELVIKDGRAYIGHSTCPDKICVKQGEISEEGQTIVCLPHKLVIEIE